MNAEYIVKIGGNISSLEKVIKKAQGQVKRISDDEVLIKLAYDGNLKEFNKTFNQVLKSSPELTVQFQYDVNKKILNQELEKLQQLTTIKMDIETGNASAKLKTMLKSLQDSYDNIESEQILHSKMEEILKYANTLKSLGVNLDKSGLEVLEEYAEDYKSLDALLQKNETNPITLFKLDKSLDKTIENTTKNVQELQSTIEKLKENGATELSENSEFKELSDKVKILSSDLEDMKQQLGSLSGEAFEEMSRSVDTLESKLSNALTRLQELREATVNPNDITYHIGDFEDGPHRLKSESYNHIISNMNWGGFDEGDFGYGILGTGVYHTPDASELKMGGANKKGYAIDLSKYKLFVASLDEEAERLMTFLGQMQGFVIAQGSSYREWDDILKKKNVNSETLYTQFKNIFGNTVMSVQEFEGFLDEMIAQMNEISAGGLQVGEKAGDFKDLPAKYDHFDTAITQLMKRLGYEGIDLRGTQYDNYNQGNTIFDLHPEDIIKTFNTQEELDTYWENNKKAIEKFNTASAQALGEAGKNIQNLTEYVEELNKRLETLAETVNALGDLSGIKDAAEAMSGAAVAGIQQGQHSHSPSVDGGNEGDNLVNGYVNSINEGTEKAREAGENLSKTAVAGLSETSTQDIENQLNSDFSEATQSQEKFELAIINTNNELQRMAELAFRADTNVNEIDRFANQSQVLKAQALETERIAREEAERTAEIARQNAEYERQQEILRGAAEAAFRMDTGQTGASQFNKLLNESYKQAQLQVDETVRITQAQMEQTAQMEKQYDLAKNFENAISDYADEISRAEGNAEDLAASLKKAIEVTKNADAGSSLDTLSSIQDEVRANTESAKKSINSMLKSLDTLDKPDKYVENFIEDVRSLSSSLKELSQQEILDPAEVAKFESVLKKLQEASRLDVNKNFKELTRTKYLDQISQYLTKYTGLSKGTREEINKIAEAMRKANSAGELKGLYDQFLKLKVGAREAGEEIQSTFTKIGNRLADMNAKFIAQFLSFQDLVRYLRQVADNVIAVDSAITELRKVSDASTERLNESFQKSSETALQLGQSIEHVINVTADWARLGYDVDAAEELARVTALFTTVGDNMSADDASSYLISTLQGFQMSADQAEDIVDKYNQVANNFAIDTAGIGEALQRSAASFNAANTDLSKSIALITATNEVVQNPESVGTLWKTMSARIRGAATELENLGEEQDEFTKTTSKLRDLVQGLTGFDIMKTEDEFKDIYEIILGIGEAWDDLTDIEQASLGEALAGKRNANALFAVLGNLDTLKGAYEAAEDAAGSAAREQENYAKSVQYSLDRLQASVEKLSVDFLNSNFLKGLVESGVSLLDVLDQIVSKTNGLTSIAAGLGAGFGFMKIGGVDAISSSLREVQDNYAVLSTTIKDYNEAAAKAASVSEINYNAFGKADTAIGSYIRSLNGASGSMKGYVGSLISARLKTIALNVATTALNAAITMGISIAITAAVSWLSKLITAEKEARQAAVDLAETYEQETESLDTQIEQYKKLYEQLEKARAKGEDTYAIKEQLSALQGELNKKYGDEFEKLNLVNGAYTDQISILKELSKEKAKDYLATNADQFDKAFDYLDKQRTYNLGELTLNEDTRGLLPILEKYGVDTNTDGTMFLPVQLKANIEDADEAMTALYADIKDYEKTHDVDLSFITDAISGQKQDIDADEKFEQYKKLRESYIDATIASNDAMAAQYQKGLEAVQAYNDALDSGENVEKAKANLVAIQNEINNTSFDNEGIRNRFLSIFDGIDEELEKRSVIDNAFDVEGNKFVEYAEKLRGLTDIDLYNLDDSQLKGAFNYLLHSFGLTTENAGLLIDKLVELGIVQRNVAASAEQLATAENSWASERDAALEKLGLLKETSNGAQYDESWGKYLDTIRELNPELANNQEELEKCALANMQFSTAIDDLSKNFATYKEALQDANALTPEYSNAINALADDLTYLTGINFSISEASDFLGDANNLELLEQAINGSDEALQQLQDHASQSIRIKIDVAAVEDLRKTVNTTLDDVKKELEELGKGGNVDLTIRPKIDTHFLSDVGWEEAAGEYATVFTQTFSNEAGDVALNFTPIIVDENGNFVDVMEPDALTEYAEGVIAGTRTDDLKLQIGGEFTGEHAIEEAEAAAMRIHNLHELQIELGLDTNEFNAQFSSFIDWLETADLGTLEAQTYLNEDPFIQALVHLANQSEEMAAKIKQIFAELGWDIKWDIAKMKVPKPSGSHITSTYAKDVYGNAIGPSYVKWDWEELDVPTNIRFERTGGAGGRRSSTSGYTPRSMSPSQKSGAASNLGGGSSGGGGGGSDHEKEDDYKENIDYFERFIKILDQQIDLLDAHLQDVVGSFAKNMILDAEEDAIKKKMAGYSSAVEMYSQKAAEALSKIPGEIAEKVQSGAVAIDEFIGEGNKDVVDAINDYQGWADKVAECKQQIVELREALRQLELQKFNNIAQDFQELFDVRNTQIDLISKAITLFETSRDKTVGRAFYDESIEQTEKQLTDLYAKHTALSKQMTKAIAAGVNVAGDEWMSMVSAIEKVNAEILDAQTNVEKYKNAIIQLYVEAFDNESNYYSSIVGTRQKAIDSLERQIALMEASGQLAGKSLYDRQINEMTKQISDLEVERNTLVTRLNDAMANGVKRGTDEWKKMVDEIYNVDAAIQETQTSIKQTEQAIKKLYLARFQKAAGQYDNAAAIRDKASSAIGNEITRLQTAGQLVGESYYQAQRAQAKKTSDILVKERKELVKRLNTAVKKGVEVGSDEWNTMVDKLYEVDAGIQQCKTSMEEFDNAILELHTATFERIQARFDSFGNELSNMAEAFSDKEVATTDNKWTEAGIAQLGLQAQQYELAKKRVADYNEEIGELNYQYQKGKYSVTEYIERLSKLKSEQWAQVKSAESAKKAILELNKARVEKVIKGINDETDAYKKLIQAEKDALSQSKELHDYEKSLQESTKNVTDIERQIAALEGDTSLSAMAKRKELEAELSDARQSLAELEYQHSIDTQQAALDQQLENYQTEREAEIEQLQLSLEDANTILAESFETVRGNAEAIGIEILAMAQQLNIDMSPELTAPWQAGEAAIGNYSDLFTQQTSAFMTQMSQVENSEWRLQDQANRSGESILGMLTQDSTNLVNQILAAKENFWNLQKQAEETGKEEGKTFSKKSSQLVKQLERAKEKQDELTQASEESSRALADAFGNRADGLVSTILDARNSANNLNTAAKIAGGTLKNTIDGSYSGANATNALGSIEKAADGVKESADAAAKSLGNMLSQMSKMPSEPSNNDSGFDWEAYQRQQQLENMMASGNGYASGTKGVSKNELAWTQENGPEAIINPATGAILTPLEKGSAVLPADQTKNIWEWSRFNPSEFANKLAQNINNTGVAPVQTNTMQVGALVQVNGNINDTMEMMQIAATQASTKIKQSFKQLSNGLTG